MKMRMEFNKIKTMTTKTATEIDQRKNTKIKLDERIE